MASQNDIADGIEERLATISAHRPYSEPQEASEPQTEEGVASEVLFIKREWLANCGSYTSTYAVLLSAPSEGKGWSRTVRRLRDYLDATGSRSVETAIEADRQLGGRVYDAVVTDVGGERLRKHGNEYRWTAQILVTVLHS